MNKIFLILVLFFIPNLAQAKIKIFSCEPELTALAREIVGDKAKILTATNSKQNPFLRIERDSELSEKIRSADMVFCSGNDLEKKWFPELLHYAFKPKVKSGEAVLMVFDGIARTDERSEARPHLNPYAMLGAVIKFTALVSKIDIDNAANYKYHYEEFAKKWLESIKIFEKKAESLKGKKIVVMDDKWDYLVKWLGLEIVTKIYNDDGSKKSLTQLVAKLKETPVDMIVFSDIEDEAIVFELSRKTKVRAVLLPITTNNLANTSTVFLLFNNIINRLLTDCSKNACQNFSSSTSLSDYLNPNQTITRQNY